MIPFVTPIPNLQVTFFARLSELRDVFLLDALLKTISESDIPEIDRDLKQFVSGSGLKIVAGWGLRGELVFPVPRLLKQRPQLIAYYRLLLGFSQKEFYGKHYGLGVFKAMEERGVVPLRCESLLPELCRCLCQSSNYLVENVSSLSKTTIHELTLLTLGPQLRGGTLNILGRRATQQVFDLIKAIVEPCVVSSDSRSLEIENAAGRIVRVEFASDPDICIRETLPSGKFRNLVAVEIKGGRDISNIHNRIGEAEKSHQKARKKGFVECWTMIGVSGLDMELARKESPSTDRFYSMEAISLPTSDDFKDFRENLKARVGISD